MHLKVGRCLSQQGIMDGIFGGHNVNLNQIYKTPQNILWVIYQLRLEEIVQNKKRLVVPQIL